jgi:hypothetical protein
MAKAIIIVKEKQKVQKYSGVQVTTAVKAEQMQTAIAEARQTIKNILMDLTELLHYQPHG